MPALGLGTETMGAVLDRDLRERLLRLQLVPLALADERVAATAEDRLEILPARLVGGDDAELGVVSEALMRDTVERRRQPGQGAEAK